ncbi:MAG: hypothetical protein GY810_31525 [Aureispira sp.]|nr:hypothetical protein [Aureispira sp.]
MNKINLLLLYLIASLFIACGETSTTTDTSSDTPKTEESADNSNNSKVEEPVNSSTDQETAINTDIDFFVEKDLGNGQKSMIGVLASVGETGQAPMEYNVNITNGKNEYRSFEANLETGKFSEILDWEMDYLSGEEGTFTKNKNLTLEITFTEDFRNQAVDIYLASNSPQKTEELLLIKGKLLEVHEPGDLPGGFMLKTKAGEEIFYSGDYELEATPTIQGYAGKEVFIAYRIDRYLMYVSSKKIE